MFGRKNEPTTPPLAQAVWFVLAEVRVTGTTKQPWTPGSRAIVQCFVPGRNLEDCLLLLDEALRVQELERIDTLRAIRYDPDDEDPDIPGDYFREPLLRAATTNETILGVFVVSEEAATPVRGPGHRT